MELAVAHVSSLIGMLGTDSIFVDTRAQATGDCSRHVKSVYASDTYATNCSYYNQYAGRPWQYNFE